MWSFLLASALAQGFPDPWEVPTTADVRVISHGEAVDPLEHLKPQGFTVLDVGASWCAPCHESARELRTYAEANEDVGVRAVSLPGDPRESLNAPAAELLGGRSAVPFFVVYDPDGRVIYEGHRLSRALRRIERRR